MMKTLDEMLRACGVTDADIRLIDRRKGLRERIGRFVLSTCRNSRSRRPVSVRDIERAAMAIRKKGRKVTVWGMGFELGFGYSAAITCAEMLRDSPKLKRAFEKLRDA